MATFPAAALVLVLLLAAQPLGAGAAQSAAASTGGDTVASPAGRGSCLGRLSWMAEDFAVDSVLLPCGKIGEAAARVDETPEYHAEMHPEDVEAFEAWPCSDSFPVILNFRSFEGGDR
jgi:hypothetical protein